jgi:hypothetical protein
VAGGDDVAPLQVQGATHRIGGHVVARGRDSQTVTMKG